MIRIVNIVATTSFETDLDLETLEKVLSQLGDVIYDPERFPGLVLRTDKGISILIFRTGKAVIAGAKSFEEIKDIIKELVKTLKSAGISLPSIRYVYIQNIVATGDLGTNVNLEMLSRRLRNAFYEPEQFPGLICRLGLGKPVMLVFSTGKVVIVGSKNVNEIQESFEELKKIVTSIETAA